MERECDLCRAERLLAEDPDYHPFLWPRGHSAWCPILLARKEKE